METHGTEPKFTWASERHLRLEFPPARLLQLDRALAAIAAARVPGLVNITAATTTLLLEFDLALLDEHRVASGVRHALIDASESLSSTSPTMVEIPVCYEMACAPDASDIARIHGISHAELMRLHSDAKYRVEFIGFAPGFGYLSGLPGQLNTPRLDTPRPRVPAGSVGIAGNQTGVYPGNTAGGWRLIGRTPLRMFDAAREKPSLLSRGDRVRFVPIDLADFHALVRNGAGHE